MIVAEARKKYLEVKKSVEDCQTAIAELQKKCDQLQDSMPGLTQEVEQAEEAKTEALDAFASKSDKTSEAELKRARAGYESAVRQRTEQNELLEASERALKRQQAELIRLNNALDQSRRAAWQAISDGVRAAIPENVFESVRMLFVVGFQCSQTRQWVLDSLFPNPSSGDFQEIRKAICEKYQIE